MDGKEVLYPQLKGKVETAKKRLIDSKASEANKDQILRFLVKLEADGTSNAQILSYLDRLTPIAELLGDVSFKEAKRGDMERVFAIYRKGKTKEYKQASINKAVQCLKCFYRWLFGLTSKDAAPEAVKWLNRQKTLNDLRASDLWTEEDIENVLKAAKTLKEKTMFSVLFEGGFRPGELRGLRMKDVVVNGDMIRCYVRGKTEKKTGERMVPILRSYHIFRMWLSQHPQRDNPEAWVWTDKVTFYDKRTGSKIPNYKLNESRKNGAELEERWEPLKDVTLRSRMRYLAKKANIKKKCNPYLLRHGALTRYYREVPGTVASKLAGHAPGSEQAQTYCHLSEEDLEDSVREMNGVKKKEKKDITKCFKCGQSLGVGDRICPHCGLSRNHEEAIKREETIEENANIRTSLEMLTSKYPELGKVLDQIRQKEGL